MAAKGTLKLVIKGRGLCHYHLNNRLCILIELFLLLCGKLFMIDDQEIKRVMSEECNLLVFVRELIQAIIPSRNKFWLHGKNNEEIKVAILAM